VLKSRRLIWLSQKLSRDYPKRNNPTTLHPVQPSSRKRHGVLLDAVGWVRVTFGLVGLFGPFKLSPTPRVCVCVVSTRTITSYALVAPLLKGTCPFSSPPLFCTIYSFCLLTFSTFSSQLLRLGTRRRVFLFSRYKLGSQPETNPLTTWINT
jgi:hypothetical protein